MKYLVKNILVFRADTRGPDTIFRSGFAPRMQRKGGVTVQSGGQMIGGVSTSKDFNVAIKYGGCYGGWVYAMYAAEGVSVLDYLVANKKFAAIDNALSQMEVAMTSVPGADIICARKVVNNSNMCNTAGQLVVNRNCRVDSNLQAAGKSMLMMDHQLDVSSFIQSVRLKR